jgi:hypothetical protein
MCLCETTMHPRRKRLDALDARSPAEGRIDAERELARARPCGCCLTPRIHLTKWVGSTLFLDDDPAALLRAIPRGERASWTTRLVAACIVLYGRPRITLFGRS